MTPLSDWPALERELMTLPVLSLNDAARLARCTVRHLRDECYRGNLRTSGGVRPRIDADEFRRWFGSWVKREGGDAYRVNVTDRGDSGTCSRGTSVSAPERPGAYRFATVLHRSDQPLHQAGLGPGKESHV